jgi:hypothetical protein
VTTTEQHANTASTPKIGRVAMLGGLLGPEGTGTREIRGGSGRRETGSGRGTQDGEDHTVSYDLQGVCDPASARLPRPVAVRGRQANQGGASSTRYRWTPTLRALQRDRTPLGSAPTKASNRPATRFGPRSTPSPRRLRTWAPVSSLTLLAGLTAIICLACSTATTATTDAEIFHPFLTGITGEGTPAKEITPGELAVDGSNSVSAGDLYVLDENHQVIDKLNAAGEYVCQITGLAGSMRAPASECDSGNFTRRGVEGGSFAEGGFAQMTVDSATGDLYITKSGAGVVDEFGPEGEYLSQIKGLSYPIAVAVDAASGDVYIVQVAEEGSGAGTLTRYEPGTATLTPFAEGTSAGLSGRLGGLAVDNSSGAAAGDVYVVDRGNNVVDKFNEAGGYEGQLSQTPEGPFLTVGGVAVDPSSGDVYVGDGGEVEVFGNTLRSAVDQFDAAGTFLGRISGSQAPVYLGTSAIKPASMAIAPTGDVYVRDGGRNVVDVFGPAALLPDVKTEGASVVTATTATVAGTVNAEGVALTSCEFEYGNGQIAACEPAASSITGEQAVTAHLIGLEGGTTYHFRLRAMNGDGYPSFGKDETLTTLPVPSIESAVAKNVTGEAALLEASIDPNGYPVTSCKFEYGTTTEYGTVLACPQSVGEGTTPVTEALQLTKLHEDTTYHWRVVAIDANGTANASSYDHTFVYDTSGGGLPDDRAYELVTPAHKDGALFGDLAIGGFPIEIANDGSRVLGEAVQCFGSAESCIANHEVTGTPDSFVRTSAGWQTTALAPPATQFPPSILHAYRPNTGAALFTISFNGGTEESFLLRQAGGSSTEIGPALGGVTHVFSTEDYSHFAFNSPGEPAFEYAAGSTKPFLVGVSGGLGSTDLISACATALGDKASVSSSGQGVMSADGSIVFFTALADDAVGCPRSEAAPPANELYARVDGEQADAHTVRISARSSSDCTGACASSQPANAEFWGASEDGSRVFFTSTQQLTNQATPNQENLYEYDLDGPTPQDLLDVSAGEAPVAGGPRVQGVTAVSADGSHVYFVAQGVLTSEERPGCTVEWDAVGRVSESARACRAAEGQDNLYLYDTETSHTSFIATLAASDYSEWGRDGQLHSVNVTPDGRFLVFTSRAQLTADDASRSGARQVFRYDAGSGGAGSLTRISIGNDGFNDDGNRSTPMPCNSNKECTEDASIVQPQNRPRRDPTMSDNGEYVFFQSPVGLTPQALDDAPIGTENEGLVRTSQTGELLSHNTLYAQNVYEWHAGHVYLISDGRDVSKDTGQDGSCDGANVNDLSSSVCLLGTDESGADVFFSTADQLVPQDTDTELDYYDARIDGGFPAPAVSPPCVGEDCHGIPAAELPSQSGGSLTFNGQGNVIPAVTGKAKKKTVKCKRGFTRKKSRCVKNKKKKTRAKKTNRRPSR